MRSQKYNVTLIGRTPLIMHADNIEWADQMDAWRSDAKRRKISLTAGDDRSPAWGWIGYLYQCDGAVVLPSDNLMTCIREGGAQVATGNKMGKGKMNYKTQSQTGIVIDEYGWPVEGKKGVIPTEKIAALIENPRFPDHLKLARELGFDLFVKRAKVGTSKHVRVRPRFDVWSASGSLTVLDETITEEVLQDIMGFGGRLAGIGDWRPSSPKAPGRFGQFEVMIEKA